jgi:DNA-binding NtrC family response regulator
MKKILVVDDQANSLKVLSAILRDEGYDVLSAESGEDALRLYLSGANIDAVISDFKMPKMDGLELFRKMNEIQNVPPFIIMSAYGTVKSAVQALQEGVTHYLIKPLDYEELSIVLKKAIRDREIAAELTALKQQIQEDNAFHGIIGKSQKMQNIFDMVRTVGKTDVSVLISGETGTGKELLARALHFESRRKEADIVCINSAALTDSLLEAELFGYVKGAFTGADANSKGRLEAADQGTLFLDEIGYMSLRLQTKLLRFLQEKTFEPVGSNVSRRVDARIIAATNLDLHEEITKGNFLRDLLYRIKVIGIRVPPLRERKEDIYLLVHHFVKRYSREYEKKVQDVEPSAMEALTKHYWPGNVRELKNCIERAVILSKKQSLSMEDFSEELLIGGNPLPSSCNQQLVEHLFEDRVNLLEVERELIQMALERYNGNKSLTAQHLGMSRKTLYKKLAGYSLE